MFTVDTKNCVIRSYLVDKEFTGTTEDVRLIAECDEQSPIPEQGQYMLSVWLEVGDYGFRDYVFGIPFGKGTLSAEELNNEIDSFIEGRIGYKDSFKDLVDLYLHNVRVIEENPMGA